MIYPIEEQRIEDISRMEANMDYAYLHLAIKVFRASISLINIIVILFSLYFGITGRDLFGAKFDTHQAIIIFIATGVISVCLFGIINAFWWGKLKEHLNIAISYAVCVSVLVCAAFICSIFASNISGADILFIILSTLASVLLFGISWSFALCVYKAKKFSKLRKKGIKHHKLKTKISH